MSVFSQPKTEHIVYKIVLLSLCSQVVAKGMIDRKSPGAIVNISSDSAYSAFPELAAYCASKGGLDMLSKVMAIELGQHQVRCTEMK